MIVRAFPIAAALINTQQSLVQWIDLRRAINLGDLRIQWNLSKSDAGVEA